jgi:hypothetical protein
MHNSLNRRTRKNSRISSKHLRKNARKSIKHLFKGGDEKEELDKLDQLLEKAEKNLIDYRKRNKKFIDNYEKRHTGIKTLREKIETTDNETKKAKLEEEYNKKLELEESEEETYDRYISEEEELSGIVFRFVKQLEKFKSSAQRDALIKHFNRPTWELDKDYRLPSK